MSEALKTTTKTYEQLLETDTDLWLPEYGAYSLQKQSARIASLVKSLAPTFKGDREFEKACYETLSSVEGHFSLYEGRREVLIPGSFAFVVPTRIERKSSEEDDEYATEADSLFPLLQYTDISTKQVFMAGMCPFVVDRYQQGDSPRAGAMVFAPVLGDIGRDIKDPVKAFETVTKIMNDTTDFAKHRLDVEVASFAALLPRLTNFGQTIETPGLVTTTGHGATVALVSQALEQARDRGNSREGSLDKIGIVGTGAIGAAVAEVILEKGLTRDIVLTDRDQIRGNQVLQHLLELYPKANITFSTNNTDAINGRNATVSAAATRFDLKDEAWQNADFNGAWIVDDSQPGAFSLQQVEAAGGNVVWPIGLDLTDGQLGTLEKFEYGNSEQLRTGPAERDELFGCEAEVLALYASRGYEFAIDSPVKPSQVLAIESLMRQVGIRLADPQCLGRYVTKV